MKLLSAFLVALSACTVGYTPPPAGPTTAPPTSVAGHPDMTGWRLLGEAWVTDRSSEIIRVGNTTGASRASCWSSPTPIWRSPTW